MENTEPSVTGPGQDDSLVTILTWSADNPEGWPTYEQAIRATAEGRVVQEGWSLGGRTGGIRPGDRAFLLRQRRDRGIVASGRFTSEVQDPSFADVEWDTALPPEKRFVADG